MTSDQQRKRFVRPAAMRLRRPLVLAHRWVSIALIAWLVVIALSGAWLAVSHSTASWIHADRYRSTDGDIGADAASEAAMAGQPKDVTSWGVVLPTNGRGVYQVGLEIPDPDDKDAEPSYGRVFVDPGSGRVNGTDYDDVGATPWLYRGHMYLWQDHGPFNAFGQGGWCRDSHNEKGGVIGVVCDVVPNGDDIVSWFGVGWIIVLLSGFYLWYWPGVRRWATALLVRRGRGAFTFNLSLHRVVGFVVWVPLLVVSFTGIAFAFPNLDKWYENATPAQRDFYLWTAPDDTGSSPAKGREPIGIDAAVAKIEERFPGRRVNNIGVPEDEKGAYMAWVTRGFDPWTREGAAGNTYVWVDQYDGDIVFDSPPSDGNVFDQAWDDWSFPLHTGDFGGTGTRVLWVALAFSPLVLAGTGIVMNRIRATKRARRRPVTADE